MCVVWRKDQQTHQCHQCPCEMIQDWGYHGLSVSAFFWHEHNTLPYSYTQYTHILITPYHSLSLLIWLLPGSWQCPVSRWFHLSSGGFTVGCPNQTEVETLCSGLKAEFQEHRKLLPLALAQMLMLADQPLLSVNMTKVRDPKGSKGWDVWKSPVQQQSLSKGV